ncbi:ribokinase [Amycolatopsis suaedae]|uniref:Ribokinase n=1 Tax=Amycolatopsis suaedae TaxID=2510978 RepID=A0A4Q7JB53_9PSEU|nr:ribokinase [Amycolatopsis suaedae]RZQ65040.1 ribokinase [Amycolatopsis suaedae]
MSELLVVGSANVDLVVETQRRPGAGETVLGGDTRVLPGGKGANTAVAAAKLGAGTALYGAVGSDEYGELLLDSLGEAGVDTSLVEMTYRPTGIAYITVTPDGENSILVSPGANNTVEPDRLTDALPGAKVLVASMEIPRATVERAVLDAAAAGVRTILNLSPVARVSGEALAALDILLVNEHEAKWLLDGGDDLTALLSLGPSAAVVTLGARGALVVESTGTTELEALRVEAVDTTGAGDAFAGALAAGLAREVGLVQAAREATWVSAYSVTRAGAQPSYPWATELREWSLLPSR